MNGQTLLKRVGRAIILAAWGTLIATLTVGWLTPRRPFERISCGMDAPFYLMSVSLLILGGQLCGIFFLWINDTFEGIFGEMTSRPDPLAKPKICPDYLRDWD